MFCSEGYRNIKVEDIAARLGLTKTIVYYYFSNKQALFKECHLRATELLERAYGEAVDVDPIEHLRKFVRAYVLSLIGDESPGAVLLDVELLPDGEVLVDGDGDLGVEAHGVTLRLPRIGKL